MFEELSKEIPIGKSKDSILKMISGIKALVVNDELFILDTLYEVMSSAGIKEVDKAQNGLDAYFKI